MRNYLCFLNKRNYAQIRNRAIYSSDVSSFSTLVPSDAQKNKEILKNGYIFKKIKTCIYDARIFNTTATSVHLIKYSDETLLTESFTIYIPQFKQLLQFTSLQNLIYCN